MSDYDAYSDEQEPQETPAPSAGPQTDWEQEARKAFAERDKARTEVRRMRIQTDYGADIAELIPEALPPTEWKGYAEKLQALRGVKEEPATPEPSSEEPPPEVDVPEETLAGIVGGPSHSAQGGTGRIFRADWMELVNTNPAEAERLFKADKVNMADLRQGLGPDR